MNQAPVGVTQTINRVVERTIQTVTTPTKETETIVKETVVIDVDEQVVNAVENNSKSSIRIYRTSNDPSVGGEQMVFVGLGFAVSDDGIVVTDNSLISSGGKYFVSQKDKLYDLSVLRDSEEEQVSLLKIKNDEKDPFEYSKVKLSSENIKLGQTVIYIGGENRDIVATGIVSSLINKDSESATSTNKVESIETSISSNFISGGLLLNLSGEIVGIKSNYMDTSKTTLFAPSTDILESLSALNDSTETN
jgi:hypothetical protein